MDITSQPNTVFHHLGRIVAVLELGARAHGEIRWLHLYYAKGLTPSAGLREPLQKHSQSVLPRLQRQDRAQVYKATLDSLARDLQEASGPEQPTSSFDSWASQVLKNREYGETDTLPSSCNPGDAVDHAQGYLEQRKALQPNRPELPPAGDSEEYCWQYHLGRTLPWNGAGNDPHLHEAFQLGLKDRRALCDQGRARIATPEPTAYNQCRRTG